MIVDTLLSDDRADVSLLGLTLILGTAVVGAAVVGAFVLDIEDSQSSTESGEDWASEPSDERAPQVMWSWEETDDGIIVQHAGGDTVTAPGQIDIRGDVTASYQQTPLDDPSLFGDGDISAGDSATIDGSQLSRESGTVVLVWIASDGSQSVVLAAYDYDFS